MFVIVPTCREKPSLSIRDVHRCVDEMYRDEASRDVDRKINNVQVTKTRYRPSNERNTDPS